jgi:tetratricopeptide (TPR) repeat protein
MNDSKSAVADYTRAIELDPKNTQHYLDRANLYVRSNWYEEAIQDLDLALSLDPERWDAYRERSRAYEGLEQHEQAIQDLGQALSKDYRKSSKAMDYRSRGLIYHRLGQYEAAIQDFDRSIEQYLRPVVYGYRSESLRALGRIEEADEDLSRARKQRRN